MAEDHGAWAKKHLAAQAAAPKGKNRCPKCYAAAGKPCITKGGEAAKRLHIGRQG